MASGPPASAVGRRLPMLVLATVTFVWGSTFVLVNGIVQSMPAVDMLAVRFVIAAVCMLGVFRRSLSVLTRRDWAAGVVLGLVYACAQVAQTIGLVTTAPARAGFLTGLYVVMTPLLGALLLRDRVPPSTAAAVALAMVGVGVLTLQPGAAAGWGGGDTLTVVAALFYALHIVGLGRWSTRNTATGLATVQVLIVAVVSVVAAIPGGVTMPPTASAWAGVVYLALAAGAGAMWAQTWAQAHMPAARAAIVMTLEPVFAAVCSVAVGADPLTPRLLIGGALVLAAMYLVELAGRPKTA